MLTSYYIGVLFIFCLFANSESSKFDDSVKKIIAEFKDRMCYQQDDLELPRLHPLNIDNLPFDLSMDMAHLKGQLKNFLVEGLGDFVLVEKELSVSATGIKAGVEFPKITVTGHLKAEGDVGEIPIDGPGGPIKIVVDDLHINLKIIPRVTEGLVTMEIRQLKVTMTKLDAVLKGLTNYEEVDKFFGTVVSKLVPELLEEILADEEQAAPIRKTLSDLINGKLPPLTLLELLEILNGKDIFGPFPEGKKCSELAKPVVHLVH